MIGAKRLLLLCAAFLVLSATIPAQAKLGPISIRSVYTTDEQFNNETTFLPGNTIHYHVDVDNTTTNAFPVDIHFRVFPDDLSPDPRLYNYDYIAHMVQLPVGLSRFYNPATLPADAVTHRYAIRIEITPSDCQGTGCRDDGDLAENTFDIVSEIAPAPPPEVWREPGGRATNLVVFVHGCCTSPDDLPGLDKTAADLRDDLESRGVADSWEIVVLDWTDSTPKLSPDHPDPFDEAYTAALQRGLALAGEIAQHSYEYVHLIGHSAGARLIDEAARCLSMMKSKQKYNTILHAVADTADRKTLHDSCIPPSGDFNTPFIHLTFLDAFTQTRCVNPSCSSTTDDKNTYGNATGFDPAGKPIGFAEHYVDKSGPPGTDADLTHAFNFDITNWPKSPDEADCIGVAFPGHQWPRCWYANSIEFLGSGGLYGYTLSREAGNDDFIKLRCRFPQGEKCTLSDPLAKCGKDCSPSN